MAIRIGTRSDGTEYYMIDFRDQDGARVREVVYGTKKEARDKLTERRAQVQRAKDRRPGGYVNPRRTVTITFADLVERFDRDYVGPNGKPRSSYYRINGKSLVAILGDVQLSEIGPEHMYKVMAVCDEQKLAAESKRKYVAVLNTYMRAAVQWKLIQSNPFAGMRRPKAPKGKVVYLTEREFSALVEIAPARLKPIYILTVNCGLRLKEATGRRWQDVNLEARTIHVNSDNKTERPDPIRLTAEACEVLSGLQVARRKTGKISPYVFVDEEGNDYHDDHRRNAISQRTRTLMREKLGKPSGYCFHTLRHTCASWLVQRGVDLARVQKHMRHESIVMTQRYAHLAPKHLDDVISALDQARQTDSGIARMVTQVDTRRAARQ